MQSEAGPSAKKRQRSENWLEDDKIILKELVRQRVRVIENKNTDTITNTKKLAAWAGIQNSFNCMCKGTPRTLTQLKAQWGLIKIKAKREKASERKGIIKTDGGSSPATEAPASEDISVWPPHELIPDINEFDSDHTFQKRNNATPAEILASMEIECRRELHSAQMANEQKKYRNLDLKAELLKAKIEYYKRLD